jgi:hypothetical protein
MCITRSPTQENANDDANALFHQEDRFAKEILEQNDFLHDYEEVL